MCSHSCAISASSLSKQTFNRQPSTHHGAKPAISQSIIAEICEYLVLGQLLVAQSTYMPPPIFVFCNEDVALMKVSMRKNVWPASRTPRHHLSSRLFGLCNVWF